MKRQLIAILAVITTASAVQAKPRTKTYAVTCDRVWTAVESVAAEKEYSSSALDDKRHTAQLVTGHGAWTGKRTMYITLSGSADSCTVSIEGVFSGLAHNDKGDLFKRIDETLLSTSVTPAKK